MTANPIYRYDRTGWYWQASEGEHGPFDSYEHAREDYRSKL